MNSNNNNYVNHFPEVARLPYKYLNIISRYSGSSINASAYSPNEKLRHYIINCHASFNCKKCKKIWTSNLITVELCWKKGKKQFDVRMYGQQCKKCNGKYIRPYISGIEDIIEICVKVLNFDKRDKGTNTNINKNANKQFNSSHDEQRCQKCKMIGQPCWKQIYKIDA